MRLSSPLFFTSVARWSAAALLLLAPAASRTARADAVSEPPSCPEGSSPNGCHGGEYCDPDVCIESSACSEGKVCKEIQGCLDTVSCSGGWSDTGSGSSEDNLLGLCGEGGTCAKGSCRAIKLCVAETAATSTGDTAGTSAGSDSDASAGSGSGSESDGTTPKKELGCGSCRAGDDSAPALLGLGVLGLAIRRSRRRR